MAKLNLNFEIKTPGDGVNVGLASEILSTEVLRSIGKDEEKIIKFYDWGTQLAKTGEVEVDRVDADTLKEVVVKSEQIFNLAKAPILLKIRELKFR